MKSWLQWNSQQLLLISLLLATLHVIMAIFGRTLPHSLYYRNNIDRMKRLEASRTKESPKALDSLRKYMQENGIKGPLFNMDSAKSVCVDILSVTRPEGYLTQTVAALLTRIPIRLQNKIRITIHNFSIPSSQNTEAAGLADLLVVKDAAYPASRHPDKYKDHENFVKETIDYILAMDSALSLGCDFALLLEDDAVASSHWAEDLLSILESLSLSPKRWLVLRLFSTYIWINWNVQVPSDVMLIVCLTATLAAVVIFTIGFGQKVYLRVTERRYVALIHPPKAISGGDLLLRPNLISLTMLLVGLGTFIVLLGKYTIFAYPDGVHDLHIGASCVANVYPRRELRIFRNYINNEFTKFDLENRLGELPKKDLHFRRFIALEEKKNGWRYQELFRLPNLFQHIGRKTSLDKDSSWETMIISHSFQDDKVPIRFDKHHI